MADTVYILVDGRAFNKQTKKKNKYQNVIIIYIILKQVYSEVISYQVFWEELSVEMTFKIR